IVSPRGRKGVNRFGDRCDVSAFYKPHAAAETLVEHASTVAVESSRNRRLLDVSRPIEITFMKPVTVDGEPTQQRIETRKIRHHAAPQTRERPTQSDVHHVDVRCGEILCESAPAIFSPGRAAVE